MSLTSERLREVLSYDPKTGVLRWKMRASNRIRTGDVAGCIASRGYWRIMVDGRPYLAHRLAWLPAHGVWPVDQLDHVDGNPGNNRIANLREANNNQSQCNQGLPSTNTSGLKGAPWCKRKQRWKAAIKLHDRHIYLGVFDSPEAAYAAYCVASQRLHDEFGRPK